MASAAPAWGEVSRAGAVASSGKTAPATSGKSSGKPEVESSGKFVLPLPSFNLPLTPEDDDEIELGEDVAVTIPKGWRLEKNTNGYWRLRYQLKDNNGNPITYVNKSGRTGYSRGSQYVPIAKLEVVKREVGYE